MADARGWRACLRHWAQTLKRDILTIWGLAREPRLPRRIKLLALLVAAYALSPIDLIPDFIPVLGYVDDVLLVPLGLWWVLRRTPPELVAEYRAQVARVVQRPVCYPAAVGVLVIWALLCAGLLSLLWT